MKVRSLVDGIAMLGLVASTGTFAGSGSDAEGGSALNQALLLVSFLLFVALVVSIRFERQRNRLPVVVWILLIWCFFSIIWSFDPLLSTRRTIGLALTISFSASLISTYDQRSFSLLLMKALFAVIALNLAVVFLMPNVGVATFPTLGAWKGLFTQKNVFGRIGVMGFLLGLVWFLRRDTNQKLALSLLAIAAVALVGSRSATSLAVASCGTALVFMLEITRRLRFSRSLSFVFLMVFVLASAGFAAWGLDFFLSQAERSDTLSGRLPLWDMLVYFGSRSPWLGAGYGAFWSASNPSLEHIWFVLGWNPVQSHNGFVELFIQIGGVGLILFCYLLLTAMGRSLPARIRSRDRHQFTALVFLFCVTLISLTESVFLVQNSIFTIIILYFSSREYSPPPIEIHH